MLTAAGLLTRCNSSSPTPERSDLTLKLVHGPEMRAFLSSLREAFYLTQPHLPDGTQIKTELVSEMGAIAALRIASGELKAEAWLAPSSSLVDYINRHKINLGAGQSECRKLFGTPVVVALRGEQEVLVGADSEHRFSWSRLMHTSATSEKQPPSAPPFQLGFSHAQPKASTTGMAALIQLLYLASGKGTLNSEDAKNPDIMEKLKGFQSQVLSYPVSENFLLSNVAANRGNDVRFAVTTEQQLLQFNAQKVSAEERLTAVYPEEGVYWEDYQLCLSQADWVTAAQRAALGIFVSFMSSHATIEAAGELGFRPLAQENEKSDSAPAVPDTRWNPIPVSSLPPVSGDIVADLFESWKDIRRPVAQVLVLDTSGSMEGDALSAGKEQFRKILALAAPGDLSGIISFGSTVQILGKLTAKPSDLIPSLDIARAVGGSSVYDAIFKAFTMVGAPELKPYRRSVLVFTDGADKNSDTSLSTLLAAVQEKAQAYGISLLIIAIDRGGANFSDLERIAQAGNGSLRISSLVDLDSVFQEVVRGI